MAVKINPNELKPTIQPSNNGGMLRRPPIRHTLGDPLPVETVIREEATQIEEVVKPKGSEWERIDLPSNFVFYPWDTISVKPFGIRDQAKLARAIKHQNITVLLDVLSATCDRDVRTLVFRDFQAVCLWHKHNSYIATAFNVSWNSRYGVRGQAKTTKTLNTETKLTITRKDYLELSKQDGLVASTVNDLEYLMAETDEDLIYLFDKAQYMDLEPLKDRIEELRKGGDRAPSVTARIEALEAKGLTFFPKIEEFIERFDNFGVQESVPVLLDAKDFKPEAAIERLKQLGTEKDLSEAEEIEKVLKAGGNYAPKEEEVPLAFELWTMFPYT